MPSSDGNTEEFAATFREAREIKIRRTAEKADRRAGRRCTGTRWGGSTTMPDEALTT